MTAILILLQFATLGFLVKMGDSMARQNLTLRWAQTQHSVMIQRLTVFGLWIPFGKTTFGDSVAAQEFIDAEIERARVDAGNRFGPAKSLTAG